MYHSNGWNFVCVAEECRESLHGLWKCGGESVSSVVGVGAGRGLSVCFWWEMSVFDVDGECEEIEGIREISLKRNYYFVSCHVT